MGGPVRRADGQAQVWDLAHGGGCHASSGASRRRFRAKFSLVLGTGAKRKSCVGVGPLPTGVSRLRSRHWRRANTLAELTETGRWTEWPSR